jgi:hypothetical protein
MGLDGFMKLCAFLLTGLIAVTSAALISYKNHTPTQGAKLIPLIVSQLPVENGVFPVEMRCDEVRSPSPNKVNAFSCLAVNNTQKKVSALAIEYAILTEEPEGTGREASLLTFDFAIHPDISEARHLKLLPPGESRIIGPSGPTEFESGTVSGVEVRIDYVEFEDKSSIGSDSQGAKMVGAMRAGAAKYKAWLVRQYKQKGMDEQATAALLEEGELPGELSFGGDSDLAEGARLYRRIMRSVYTSQGAAELKRDLNK